jgi:hypothetical protein
MLCRGLAALLPNDDDKLGSGLVSTASASALQLHLPSAVRAMGAVDGWEALAAGVLLCPPVVVHRSVTALLWLAQQGGWGLWQSDPPSLNERPGYSSELPASANTREPPVQGGRVPGAYASVACSVGS